MVGTYKMVRMVGFEKFATMVGEFRTKSEPSLLMGFLDRESPIGPMKVLLACIHKSDNTENFKNL